MTAYELCKFCRDNKVSVEIYPDWLVDGMQAVNMYKYPGDGSPTLNYRHTFYADWPEEKADELFEAVLRHGLNAINKKLEEENA